jgi:hypothetical protein
MFTFGFVQEEQMLLTTSWLYELYKNIIKKEYNILNSNLEIQSLLTKTNIVVHQNMKLGLYSGYGIKRINKDPKIIDQFYKKHNTQPSIYILSKAIPILEEG